jgi:hypothetical protein
VLSPGLKFLVSDPCGAARQLFLALFVVQVAAIVYVAVVYGESALEPSSSASSSAGDDNGRLMIVLGLLALAASVSYSHEMA